MRSSMLSRLAVAAVVALAAGCGARPVVQLRLDPASYIYHGYQLGGSDGVEVVVEDMRFAAEVMGTVVIDLAIVNRRHRPIRVNLGLIELSIANRDLLPQQSESLLVPPGAIERVSLAYRTDLLAREVNRGSIKVNGVTLEDGQRLEFSASFHKATEDELARERGEHSD